MCVWCGGDLLLKPTSCGVVGVRLGCGWGVVTTCYLDRAPAVWWPLATERSGKLNVRPIISKKENGAAVSKEGEKA